MAMASTVIMIRLISMTTVTIIPVVPPKSVSGLGKGVSDSVVEVGRMPEGGSPAVEMSGVMGAG